MTRPRPSASVVLTRDATAGGVEVYMLTRPATSRFAPGASVFPGGALDPADGMPPALGLAPGFDPRIPAIRMRLDGRPDTLLHCAALHLCALRELFEESGVLIGGRDDGGLCGADDAALLATARRELLDGMAFSRLAGHGLRLHPQGLTYLAHFVTPPDWPVRFDTRFFLVASPPGQEPRVDPAEAVEGGWVTPAEALDRRGDRPGALLTPTRLLLEDLREQASTESAIRVLGSREVHRRCI